MIPNMILRFISLLFDQSYSGLYSWRLSSNFFILRTVSYAIDCRRDNFSHTENIVRENDHKTRDNQEDIITESLSTRGKDVTVVEASQPCDSLLHCLSYLFFAPLYIAGPVINYETYYQQSREVIYPHKNNLHNENIPFYALRLLFVLFLLEFFTSRYSFFAVLRSDLLFSLPVYQQLVLFYCLLKLMWLKFLFIWRFFRLWAMCENIFPPENMSKCLSDNYSLENFWRHWHVSFYLWLQRYLYRPMGGRKWQYLSVPLVFLFVALWHDLDLKLVLWGLLNACFYFLEVSLKSISRRAFRPYVSTGFYSLFAAFAGALYILVLMAVNLLGYAIGLDRVILSWEFFQSEEEEETEGKKMLWIDKVGLLCTVLYFLSVGVALMRYLESLADKDGHKDSHKDKNKQGYSHSQNKSDRETKGRKT
jgi:protein-cysteine N-palmitoyltransferase HHAT